ncbi:MAG: SusE domain-containing protein [Bacteroidales bacterium]|nr:SusE domain-containing protein [Bacteroidales bacterium]
MKITKYIMMLAAAAGLSAACQKDEIVTFNPEDVVAPVLHAVSDVVVTVDNKDTESLKFTWDAASFGVNAQVYYTLNMSANDVTVNLFSGATGTSYAVSYDALNNKAFNDLGIASGEAGEVSFTLGAKLNAGETYWADPVKANITPTSAEKVYPMVYVIGNYCGWSHDTALHLYNFSEDEVLYQGVVDFGAGDEKTGGFKITPGPSWDAEWGGPGSADEEPASLTLLTSGGSDIKNYVAKRYYHFTLDTKTCVLTKKMSFDQVGIIGLNGDWENDIVMEYSVAKQRFYADIDVPAATEMKFRMDAGWDINYGGDLKGLSNGGDNIPVEPGQYRVYFNMNNLDAVTATLDANMYGKEEGGAVVPPAEDPEPAPVVGWGLVGEYNSWGGTPDIMLASDGTYLVAKGVELSGQVKFRKDGGWDVNFGAPGDVEPVEIAVNTELELVAGGKNFTIAAGTYDVYLDETNAKAWFINDGSYPGGGEAPVAAEWGLIGSLAACNSWSVNIPLFIDGDYMVAKGVVFAEGDQFKFRKGETWGTEVVYEGTVMPDAEYACAAGSGNSTIGAAGTYDVYLAQSLDKFYVMTPGKTPEDAGEAVVTYVDPSAESFVVGFSGSAIGWDDPSFDTNDRAAFVSKNVTDEKTFAGTYEFKLEGLAVSENDEIKVRINGQWIGVGGATVEGLTVTGTDNFIAGETGTYTAVITFAWDGTTHSDVKVVFSK